MRSVSLVRSLAQVSTVLLLFLGASSAGAQCTITGPVALCGGSGDLCGPEGDYEYEWRGPSGTLISDQRCITVAVPGTYSLRTFDFMNGLWAGPCLHTVVPGGTSACTISGATQGCQGSALQLCAAEGLAEYRWSGPNEFFSSSRCVEVTVPGLYQAQTRNSPDECWSNPCEASVTFVTCQKDHDNCPVAPWRWLRDCRSCRSDKRLFPAKAMDEIAKCIDSKSSTFDWKDERGLCRTFDNRSSLRDRARRQLAGVLANVCAHDMQLKTRLGAPRGLDSTTPVQLEGFSGTVGSWVTDAEKQLADLERCSQHLRKTKDDYGRLIRTGWQINHGQGMGKVCVPKSGTESMFAEAEETVEEESLVEEVRDPDATLEVVTLNNPSVGFARLAYVVPEGEQGESVIGVFDVAGRMVRELDRGVRGPGRYELSWDGRDASGNSMRNGAYFVKGRIGAQRIEGRLILLR